MADIRATYREEQRMSDIESQFHRHSKPEKEQDQRRERKVSYAPCVRVHSTRCSPLQHLILPKSADAVRRRSTRRRRSAGLKTFRRRKSAGVRLGHERLRAFTALFTFATRDQNEERTRRLEAINAVTALCRLRRPRVRRACRGKQTTSEPAVEESTGEGVKTVEAG